MKRKYKFTPFARLFFFLLVFVPLSYFGYKIYNGEMTVSEIKSKIENKTYTPKAKVPKNVSDNQCNELLKLKDREIEILKNRIQDLEGK